MSKLKAEGSRSNPSPEAIAKRAYELFEEGGRKSGNELEDWLAAETELATAGEPPPGGPTESSPPPSTSNGRSTRVTATAQPKRRSSERDSTP